MALACSGIVIFISMLKVEPRLLITTGAMLASACALWLYLRFGFLYAAVISVAYACVVPFQLSLPPASERAILAMVLVLILLTSIRAESFETRDFKKERSAMLQACLVAGIYLAVNLRLQELGRAHFGNPAPFYQPHAGFPPLFYWTTYGLTFLVPALGLYYGMKSRKRLLMTGN